MATQHEYPAHVSWQGGRDGSGLITNPTSGNQISIAVSTEFQGPGGASNPEELITSAVAGCYSITFGIIASNRKLPVQSLEVDAVGIVEQNGPSLIYTKITIKPTIVLTAGATEAQIAGVTDMAHKADGYCIITNAIRGKVEVVIEPEVTVAP